jgi:integrase
MKRTYNPDSRIPDLVNSYLLVKPVCLKYEQTMRARLHRFNSFIGCISLGEIDSDHVNLFLLHLERASNLAPHTVSGYRTAIRTILRFGRWQGDFGDLRKVRKPWKTVEGWTLDEIRTLLTTASYLKGGMANGVSFSHFWQTAIHCGYCTGLRWGDLTRLSAASISSSGVCSLVQHKTGRPLTVQFSPDAVQLIRGHYQETVLPWPYTQKSFCELFRRLVEAADVSPGTFKWLRRSAGSYADAAHRGDGQKLLGHAGMKMFDEHYNVAKITNLKPIQPVPLFERPQETLTPATGVAVYDESAAVLEWI